MGFDRPFKLCESSGLSRLCFGRRRCTVLQVPVVQVPVAQVPVVQVPVAQEHVGDELPQKRQQQQANRPDSRRDIPLYQAWGVLDDLVESGRDTAVDDQSQPFSDSDSYDARQAGNEA